AIADRAFSAAARAGAVRPGNRRPVRYDRRIARRDRTDFGSDSPFTDRWRRPRPAARPFRFHAGRYRVSENLRANDQFAVFDVAAGNLRCRTQRDRHRSIAPMAPPPLKESLLLERLLLRIRTLVGAPPLMFGWRHAPPVSRGGYRRR